MNWGRLPHNKKNDRTRPALDSILSPGNAVVLFGTLFCLLFFCLAVTGVPEAEEYPADRAADAWEAFGQEHQTLTAVLGIDAYFPEETVSVSTFGEPPKRWNFADYMRDALWHFVFGERP